MNTICLAGGCFWGVEELFQTKPGVHKTTVGYTGGHTDSPVYETVKTGTTGHAEALKIEFDPSIWTLEDLLHFFFSIHDPTTVDQQGNDKGSQYRSAIFYKTPSQKETAINVIKDVEAKKYWKKPIVTTLEELTTFHSAEEYHRAYLRKNPGGYTCHWKRY